MILAALEFPPISHLLEWKNLFGSGATGFNKIALVNVFAAVLTLGLFFIAASKKSLVPKGIQNFAEAGADFVHHGIAEEAMVAEVRFDDIKRFVSVH